MYTQVMDFSAVLPLLDSELSKSFELCKTNDDFLAKIINIYNSSPDARVKEATLAVFMAYRDHYPKYLKKISPIVITKLNEEIEMQFPRLIKLRRIALAELVKVA